MDVKEAEKLGTGLTDVIKLLLDLPTEQLLSLTYQLGKTPEEDLVHALSLLFLNRETQGLDRLQALQDNSLANHLAGKWHTAGGKLEDFREQCGHFDNVAAVDGTPLHLARMFKVLSEKRLCDRHRRDLAYSRAVSAYGEKNNYFKVQLLIEEAKDVCGPQFAETMSVWMDPPFVGEADKESNTALPLMQGKPDDNLSMPSLPCSLKASSSWASYPTHLEISLPSTRVHISDQITPVVSQPSRLTPQSLAEDELENSAPGSDLSSNSSETSSMLTSENTSTATLCSIATTDSNSPQEDEKQTTTTPPIRSKSQPSTPESPPLKVTVPIKTDTGKETEEEEEEEEVDTFYAFVILHAAEDVDMAEAMRERVESICGGSLVGATFSEDFALPGRSTLRCIDDAIENSAFTILLLTDRFVRNRRFQVEAEAALINSIENMLKKHTVIPLLTRDNGMAEADLPMVLRTLVPLKENRSFDRNIKKVLSAKRVQTQRSAWSDGQKVKKEMRRQERMKEQNKNRKILGDVCAATAKLQLENLRAVTEQTLLMQRELQDILTIPCGGGSLYPLQPQNITINNSKCVMIGNDSSMTVDYGDSNTGRQDN